MALMAQLFTASHSSELLPSIWIWDQCDLRHIDTGPKLTSTGDSFKRIAITTRETWSRMLARFTVRATPGWFFLGASLIATSGSASNGFSGQRLAGALFMILASVLILLSPVLPLRIYSGKVWNSQPWLIGFEGHMDLREIEKKIFGFPCERFPWASYGSSLSRHETNEMNLIKDECEGTDPLLPDRQQDKPTEYQRPIPTGEEGGDLMRNFTIVDTFTMTATMCSASRPPVIVLLCGSEGGMQRAILCSYDWTSQTFYRDYTKDEDKSAGANAKDRKSEIWTQEVEGRCCEEEKRIGSTLVKT